MTRTRPATGGATLVPPSRGHHCHRRPWHPLPTRAIASAPRTALPFSSLSCFCQTLAHVRRAAAGYFWHNRQLGPLRPALHRARVAAAISYVCGRGAGAGAAGEGPVVRLSSRGHGLVQRASCRFRTSSAVVLRHRRALAGGQRISFGAFQARSHSLRVFAARVCCRTVPQCAGGFADVAHLYQSQRAPSEQAAFAHCERATGLSARAGAWASLTAGPAALPEAPANGGWAGCYLPCPVYLLPSALEPDQGALHSCIRLASHPARPTAV